MRGSRVVGNEQPSEDPPQERSSVIADRENEKVRSYMLDGVRLLVRTSCFLFDQRHWDSSARPFDRDQIFVFIIITVLG